MHKKKTARTFLSKFRGIFYAICAMSVSFRGQSQKEEGSEIWIPHGSLNFSKIQILMHVQESTMDPGVLPRSASAEPLSWRKLIHYYFLNKKPRCNLVNQLVSSIIFFFCWNLLCPFTMETCLWDGWAEQPALSFSLIQASTWNLSGFPSGLEIGILAIGIFLYLAILDIGIFGERVFFFKWPKPHILILVHWEK